MTYQEYYAQNKERFIKELSDFVRIKSISADVVYKKDIAAAQEWVMNKLREIGLEDVKTILPAGKTADDGNAVVVGQKIFNPELPTLLVYGHYDVQPADPLEKWVTDPFEPTIKDGIMYARGSMDNKGQIYTNLIALEYYFKHVSDKKWNIKIFVEGEEEISGPTTEEIIANHEFDNEIKADYVYISDGPWNDAKVPTVGYSLRGIIYFDLNLKAAELDMHSGIYGNAILNPGNLAGYIIYKLKDIKKNRVRVPNFYKSVRKPSDEEVAQLNKISPNWEQVMKDSTGLAVTKYLRKGMDFGFLALTGLRPSFDVHGIHGGYTDPGSKTIIPSKMTIKFSFRLVPYQDPDEITELVKKYLTKIIPKGIEWELVPLGKAKPYLTDPNDPKIKDLVKAFEKGYGLTPALSTSGGSIGIVNTFKEAYGMTTLLADYGLPDDGMHAPNEKFELKQMDGGYATFLEFLTA